jgi:hypothetical protein
MDALLVVLTNPASESAEAAYNDWYQGSHLPDVLRVPGYRRATRYRSAGGLGGGPSPFEQRYLALYELEAADEAGVQAISDEHMRRIAAGEMRRTDAIDGPSMRALYYRAVGPRGGQPFGPPGAVFLVFSDPVPGREDEYNAWYQGAHLEDVLAVPGFVAARRYAVTDVNMLGREWVVPSKYLCVYELDVQDAAGLQASLAELSRRVGARDQMRMSDAIDGASVKAAAFLRHGEPVLAET